MSGPEPKENLAVEESSTHLLKVKRQKTRPGPPIVVSDRTEGDPDVKPKRPKRKRKVKERAVKKKKPKVKKPVEGKKKKQPIVEKVTAPEKKETVKEIPIGAQVGAEFGGRVDRAKARSKPASTEAFYSFDALIFDIKNKTADIEHSSATIDGSNRFYAHKSPFALNANEIRHAEREMVGGAERSVRFNQSAVGGSASNEAHLSRQGAMEYLKETRNVREAPRPDYEMQEFRAGSGNIVGAPSIFTRSIMGRRTEIPVGSDYRSQ
jgi:hypothetical protein